METLDSHSDGSLDLDVVIVGAGFNGIYLLHRLRDGLGLKCKIFEAGTDLGGIWHWNCYPGARVDTEVPIYEYSLPQVWKDWYWTERFPGFAELRAYFDHVDKVLDIRKDVAFNTRVVGAHFDKNSKVWQVKADDGRISRTQFLILASGLASQRYWPEWKGLDTFQGELYHSSFWPSADVDVKGKRIAIVGTGSTGIQIAQETSKEAASVTVFQRTPNLCLPMKQRKLTKEEQDNAKSTYSEIYKYRLTTFAGMAFDFALRKTLDETPEQREAFYQDLWDKGGFRFWLATYMDMLFDKSANDEAYKFWVKKTRERISDPVKRDILAPLQAPHAYGTKRPSLEQDFYEEMDKPNNHVVNVKQNPIVEIKENGIVTADGKLWEADIIALATGFDAITGEMRTMDLRDENGLLLSDKWKDGTWTYLGLTCHDFPNMFFPYGAQGPTAFANGPTCAEVQGDWIVDAIAKCEREGIVYLNATREAEEEWKRHITELSDATLFPTTDSWYMGSNIPGKPREQLNYTGGLPMYRAKIKEVLDNGFQGFVTLKA
ncbi:hypothetical protein ANO11243_021040 [Dothideomycetidae sp. 11243]|nr:hypothetical protein ANO11243_021040 [fungal sp. No.11243]